jgi:uncharacterized protein
LEFEWDEKKRWDLIERRGVDLLYAALIFEGFVLTAPDRRHDYGEDRLISIGLVGSECFVVVHTTRGRFTRLVTAWKGGRRERRGYQTCIPDRTAEDERGG